MKASTGHLVAANNAMHVLIPPKANRIIFAFSACFWSSADRLFVMKDQIKRKPTNQPIRGGITFLG